MSPKIKIAKYFHNENVQTFDPEAKNKIVQFIDDIYDILKTMPDEGLEKILEVCYNKAYGFSNCNPSPKLGDCLNQFIKDRNTFNDSTKYYHFYNAILYKFVIGSLINDLDQNRLYDLKNKLQHSLQNFKDF